MRPWLVAVILTTGCNRLLSLEETYPVDARPDAIGCSGALFIGPDPLVGFEGGDGEYDSQLRFDGLELWFTIVRGGETDLFVAKRGNPNAAFGAPQVAAFVSTAPDYDPALTGDGLRLMFVTGRNGGREVFETTRAALDQEFGPPSGVTVPSTGIESIDLSDDGLRLYYTNSAGDLWMVNRPGHDAPFTDAIQLLTAVAVFPTLSPDERELFYLPVARTNEIWRMVRPSATAEFDPATAIKLRDGTDPDMAGDGTTLTLTVNNGVSVMTRPCM